MIHTGPENLKLEFMTYKKHIDASVKERPQTLYMYLFPQKKFIS